MPRSSSYVPELHRPHGFAFPRVRTASEDKPIVEVDFSRPGMREALIEAVCTALELWDPVFDHWLEPSVPGDRQTPRGTERRCMTHDAPACDHHGTNPSLKRSRRCSGTTTAPGGLLTQSVSTTSMQNYSCKTTLRPGKSNGSSRTTSKTCSTQTGPTIQAPDYAMKCSRTVR